MQKPFNEMTEEEILKHVIESSPYPNNPDLHKAYTLTNFSRIISAKRAYLLEQTMKIPVIGTIGGNE